MHVAHSEVKYTDCRIIHNGFALVIALSLVAFLTLLMLALIGLVRLETHAAQGRADYARARQNAFLGALHALGELQKVAGHDQRVTARAEIFDANPDTVEIEGVSEPYWTGVWTTNSADPAIGGHPYQIISPIKEGVAANSGGALSWLVSADEIDPLSHVRDVNEDVLLLRVEPQNPLDIRNIYLPREELQNAKYPGHYAWWIADEGMKASLGLPNHLVRSEEEIDRRVSLLTAPRMAPEFISYADPTYDLSLLSASGNDEAVFDAYLARSITLGEAEILLHRGGSIATDVGQVVRNHSHSITPLAYGILSDVREGGLKKNLSAAFSDSTAFAQLLQDHGGELVFGPRANEYSPKGSVKNRGANANIEIRRDPGGPSWEQLRSFYNLRADTNGVTVQPQINEQMGVHPVISHFQIHFHMLLMETTNSTPTEPEFVVRLLTIPAVVLWNPYNVPLEPTDYSLYYVRANAGAKLDYEWTAGIRYNVEGSGAGEFNPSEVFEGYASATPIRLNINAGFAPGEARLFIPEGVSRQQFATTTSAGNDLIDAGTAGDIGYIYSDLTTLFKPEGTLIGDIEMHLQFRKNAGVGGIGNLIVLLGRANTLANMVKEGPLQGIGGFNHYDRLEDLKWTIPADSIFPPHAQAPSDEPIYELLTSYSESLGPWFPVTGVSNYLRMLENAHEIVYKGFPHGHPRTSFLASYNVRAVRSDRSPVEHRAASGKDQRFNPLYRSTTEMTSELVDLKTTAWSTLYDEWLGVSSIPIGPSDAITSSVHRNALFELPSGKEYFQSIASLQHASVAPSRPRDNTANAYLTYGAGQSTSEWNVNNHYPTFPLGNSIAPLAVPLNDRSKHSWTAGSGLNSDPQSTLYDMSYLLNDQLWDKYFFAEYDTEEKRVYNPRYALKNDYFESALHSYTEAAGSVMVVGSFNVNSTSVDSWRALIGGLVGATVETRDGRDTEYTDRAPYSKTLVPIEGNADGLSYYDSEVYAGYRTLGEVEIKSLAEAIVQQVKKRGPFISLSHFVNRVIENEDFRSSRELSNLQGRERAIGALQAALEKSTVNKSLTQAPHVNEISELNNYYEQFEVLTGAGSLSFGQPGFVTQADLLSRIGSVLTPRSDTFKIRSYGDDTNPLTGEVTSRAWCEMTVQRIPDELREGSNERRFEIVAFRWLNDEEI